MIYVFLFVIAETLKFLVMGPINLVIIPIGWVKMQLQNKTINKRSMEIHELITDRTRIRAKMVEEANRLGFFTDSTNVTIKGRETELGYGKIIAMAYDPEYWDSLRLAKNGADPDKLVLIVKFPGDFTEYVNLEHLTK